MFLMKYFRKLIKNVVPQILFGRYLVYKAHHREGVISLTFDDGPNDVYTPQVLGILSKYGVRATFYLIGEKAALNENLVQQIKEQGHSVAIHCFQHQKYPQLTTLELHNDIVRALKVLEKYVTPALLHDVRPPEGKYGLRHLMFAIRNNIRFIMWSVDSNDYQLKGASHIISTIQQTDIVPGDIVLMHDDNQFSVEALPAVIEWVHAKGLRFVTIDQLLTR